MGKYYEIAGFKFNVKADKNIMYEKAGCLKTFATKKEKVNHEFQIEIVDTVSQPEGECSYSSTNQRVYKKENKIIRYFGSVESDLENAYLRIERCENKSNIQVRRADTVGRITAKTILDAAEIEHFSIQNKGFILHSSYIIHNGKAILFTAPSGTGKSTQADLWEKYRGAEIINGDRSIVRCLEEGIFACGLPFSGSSQICKNVTVPLGAIVYLGQAPQNELERLSGSKAFRTIWEGVSVNTWDAEDVATCMDLVKKVVEEIPIYRFDCLPDESAVKFLEQTLVEVW